MTLDTALARLDELDQYHAHAVSEVLAVRHKGIVQRLRAGLAAQVTIGSTVSISSQFTPEVLQGMVGTVEFRDAKHANVLLDEESTRRYAAAVPTEPGRPRTVVEDIPLTALERLDIPEGFAELVEYILDRASIEDLNTLSAARSLRLDTLAGGLAENDLVMAVDVRPQYLEGLTGIVESVDRTNRTCIVSLDEDSTNRLRSENRSKHQIPDTTARFRVGLTLASALPIGRH
ncbi:MULTISPECIES: hypothetical protein [unclassified Crossiella]|uniref:hypothetical protein n=1 Tax=unclassified Crossiella TaxID=2620835 RepID=UPI001FFEDAEB|nr:MULTISPECIES: hypothetical protein [unclassified Crossiella]MCK2240035.1 hypothetical protein [Crossiella sp. S99.2]MCK2252743.1 hypothetical protein [Crossiella sp. S99.1]